MQNKHVTISVRLTSDSVGVKRKNTKSPVGFNFRLNVALELQWGEWNVNMMSVCNSPCVRAVQCATELREMRNSPVDDVRANCITM